MFQTTQQTYILLMIYLSRLFYIHIICVSKQQNICFMIHKELFFNTWILNFAVYYCTIVYIEAKTTKYGDTEYGGTKR
jgi:hypothetical protein